jgi:beta-N-acetylhexosaminidase
MKAISDHFPNPYVRAVKAGVDVLFISHTAERQIEAADSLYRAVLSGEIPESRIDASVGRILACKREYAGGGPQGALGNLPPGEPGKDSLAVRVSRGSLTVLRKEGALGPSALAAGGALIDVAPGNLTGAEDSGTLLSIAARLSGLRSAWSATRVPLDPSVEEIDAALAQASSSLGNKSSVSLALSLSAPLAHEGQVELLARCAKLAASKKAKFLVFLMRSPYDAPELARLCARASGVDATILAAYEYTELSAASVADYLAGEFEAKGVCPVTLPP